MSELKDPRVFLAAESTLLSWNRTSLTLMGFGFVIERFGILLYALAAQHIVPSPHPGFSQWIGISFIMLGALASCLSVLEYRQIIQTLKPSEIPNGRMQNLGVYLNLIVALLGVAFSGYLLYNAS
jgi:putative membrane protein